MTPISLNNTIAEPYVAAAQKPGSPAGSAPAGSVSVPAEGADHVQLSPTAAREVEFTGRVAENVTAGNITTDQAQQLYGQIATVHQQIATDRQANDGTLSASDAQAIRQTQNQLSGTIYSDAHNGAAPPSAQTVPKTASRDTLEAGRIALNAKAGNLSSTQAQQLGSQLGTIEQQAATDAQANGGTLSPADVQAINQLQTQLSQQIYQTAHPAVGPEPVVNQA